MPPAGRRRNAEKAVNPKRPNGKATAKPIALHPNHQPLSTATATENTAEMQVGLNSFCDPDLISDQPEVVRPG